MEERNPRMLTCAMAIAELIVNSENQKETLLAEKFEALKKSWSLLELYASEGFDEKILDAIMEKKSAMIWWSKASLKAPLSREATERYIELFRNFYGSGADKILGGG